MIDDIERVEGKRRAKSTISDNLDKLIDEGYPIERGGRKGFRLAGDESMLQYEDITGYEMLTGKIVEAWLLLFWLNEKGFFTFKRINDKYLSDKIDMITDNDTGLRKRLDLLEEKGFITKSKKEDIGVLLTENQKAVGNGTCYYMISESAPLLTLISEDDALDFGYYYTDTGYAGELRERSGKMMKGFFKKIKVLALTFTFLGATGAGIATVANEPVMAAEASVNKIVVKNTTKTTVAAKRPLKSITLNATSINLQKGRTYTLKVSYNPSNTTDSKNVKWTAGNAKVATVSNAMWSQRVPEAQP